jgi:hypothetical protein
MAQMPKPVPRRYTETAAEEAADKPLPGKKRGSAARGVRQSALLKLMIAKKK